jgi:Ni/Co efflux regulator RcnB
MLKKIAFALVAASLIGAPAFAQGSTPANTQTTTTSAPQKTAKTAVKTHSMKKHAKVARHHKKTVKHAMVHAKKHARHVVHHAVKHPVKKPS